jgi:hypothetical protein
VAFSPLLDASRGPPSFWTYRATWWHHSAGWDAIATYLSRACGFDMTQYSTRDSTRETCLPHRWRPGTCARAFPCYTGASCPHLSTLFWARTRTSANECRPFTAGMPTAPTAGGTLVRTQAVCTAHVSVDTDSHDDNSWAGPAQTGTPAESSRVRPASSWQGCAGPARVAEGHGTPFAACITGITG